MGDLPLQGGCLCGGVRFELNRRPLSAGYCHCTRCQRRTGTASSAQARVEGSAVRIAQGEDLLRWWRHPEGGFEKGFCGVCGGQLFSRNPDDPEQMSVRLGAFDGDLDIHPTFRAHVGTAAAWEPIPDDGLERFEGPTPRF